VLRSIGLPARYMSGFILTHPLAGKAAPDRRQRTAHLGVGVLPRCSAGSISIRPINE
jgi:hypothetical protein